MDLEKIEDLSQLRQIEAESTSLKDLRLEIQLKFLEAFKNIKDCEKGKARGKGFGNSLILNRKRSGKVYTVAESKFSQLAKTFGVDFVHEHHITVRDTLSQKHHYKLDFFSPEHRIAVEISPSFHFSYKIVAIRDKIRKKALKRHGIKTFTVKATKNNDINAKYARKVLRLLKQSGISPECLEYWLNEAELLNSGNIALGLNETKEAQKLPEFKICPIPRGVYANSPDWWHHCGFGLRDGLYTEKGVFYLPNFSDKGKDWVESWEYRLNSSDSQNGAFKRFIQSIIHESLHYALFAEIGENSALFDNIDKKNEEEYEISAI